jgi:hypothetical protein
VRHRQIVANTLQELMRLLRKLKPILKIDEPTRRCQFTRPSVPEPLLETSAQTCNDIARQQVRQLLEQRRRHDTKLVPGIVATTLGPTRISTPARGRPHIRSQPRS